MIYTSSFTSKEEGIVSIAGPLTNFAVFTGYISSAIGCKVVVEKEETSESARATRSMPDKPSIDAS